MIDEEMLSLLYQFTFKLKCEHGKFGESSLTALDIFLINTSTLKYKFQQLNDFHSEGNGISSNCFN